jgi:adenosine deaminase
MMQDFFDRIPKIELHAHLNGSISLELMDGLIDSSEREDKIELRQDLKQLGGGVPGNLCIRIEDFFPLFGFIYKLTDTPAQLRFVFFESHVQH